jgi:short-subunit dehydrogenase
MKTIYPAGTALITGGSSGIGYAIANELAVRRYNIILVSNQEVRLTEVCEEFTTRHRIKAWPVFMDLAEPGAALKLYEWCRKEKLQIDVLVNNAGIFFFGEVTETDPEKAQQMMVLHTTTPALLCALFAKEMKQRRSGHILNISSLSAFMPYPGIAFYSATKRFLKSFSRSLRTEMLDYNVNVTCICPGAVSTHLYALSEEKLKTALKTGIMMRADTLAYQAVNAMFRRRSVLVPGFINKVFLLFIYLVPNSIIALIRRHSHILPPDEPVK